MNYHKLKLPKWIFYVVIGWTLVIALSSMSFATVNGSPPSGLTHSGASIFTWTISESQISVTATPSSSSSCFGTSYTSRNDTLTLTSTSAASLIVTVKSISGNGKVMLNDTAVSQGHSATYELAANGTLSIYVSSGGNVNESTTLDLGISYVKAGTSVNLTFQPVAETTYTVNDTPVNTTAQSISGNPASGFTVSADDSHYILVGATLVDGSGNATSLAANAGKLYPTVSGTVTPIFAYDQDADGIAPFLVGTSTFWNYNSAKAAAGSSGTIVLNDDYTLPAGSYEVPQGVTLLIPFDDANTVFTNNHKNKGGLVEGGTSAATGPFRTLTMANGANIVVNGTLCLPAKLNAPGGGKTNAGAPTGKVPYIVMQGNSNITLNSGAYLYCYGFITGSGSVTVNSGASAYECFQIRDYRGGKGSSNIDDVFPSSQYYIQNVEVPMTINSGGKLTGISAVTVSIVGVVYMDNISVIGTSNSLFTNTGSVTKRYDGSTDRLIIDIDGNASLGSVSLDFGYMGANIDSAKFVLGLNNNMTVNVNSGTTTINQALALQPGAIVNIASGAGVVLNKNLYVYDADEWGDFVYCEDMTVAKGGIDDGKTTVLGVTSQQEVNNWAAVQVAFAPGKSYTRTLADLVDAQINVNGTLTATAANLYTTNSGASIISSEGTGVVVLTAGTETSTSQADMNGSSDLQYYSIPITSAKLKNGDGSYVSTTTNTYTYCGDCLQWLCEISHGHATNVELGNSLNMYFAFWTDKITESTKGNFSVILSYPDGNGGTENSLPIHSEQWILTKITIDGKEQAAYVVPYRGLAAKQMCDVITITLYNGSDVVHTWSNSIRNYAMRMLADHSDNTELRTLLVDMLNYGAACQTYFNYNTTDLANADLSAEQRAWATDDITITNKSTPNDYHDGSNLITTSNIQFAVAFNNSATIAKIEYTFANHWNDGDDPEKVVTVTRSVYHDGSEPFIIIKNLVVADARQEITITVYDSGGNKLGSWTDSIEFYCARMISSTSTTAEQKAVCTAFMKFADSAEAYLEGERL